MKNRRASSLKDLLLIVVRWNFGKANVRSSASSRRLAKRLRAPACFNP